MAAILFYIFRMEKLILILQIFSTLALTGVIWIIQLVQYPFFSYIERESFTAYHDAYRFWITPIAAPLMLIELLSAFLILLYPPKEIAFGLLCAGLVLALAVWLSTFFIQVPLHEKLAAGFDADAHLQLVRTNWIRTAAWTLRAVLILYFAWQTIRS